MVRISEKHRRPTIWFHWINFPVLSLLIWSGALIYWADQAFIKFPKTWWNQLGLDHRLAEGMGWHFFLMWIFFLNGTCYLAFLLLSGRWRELLPTKYDFQTALPYLLYDLKLSRHEPVLVGKYNPVQKMAYCGAIFLSAGSLISGLAIYKPVQLGTITSLLGGYSAARFIHFMCMCGLVFFIIIHVIQVLRAGWNNFRAMVAGYEIHKD